MSFDPVRYRNLTSHLPSFVALFFLSFWFDCQYRALLYASAGRRIIRDFIDPLCCSSSAYSK